MCFIILLYKYEIRLCIFTCISFLYFIYSITSPNYQLFFYNMILLPTKFYIILIYKFGSISSWISVDTFYISENLCISHTLTNIAINFFLIFPYYFPFNSCRMFSDNSNFIPVLEFVSLKHFLCWNNARFTEDLQEKALYLLYLSSPNVNIFHNHSIITKIKKIYIGKYY